jgi:hypothetical protein
MLCEKIIRISTTLLKFYIKLIDPLFYRVFTVKTSAVKRSPLKQIRACRQVKLFFDDLKTTQGMETLRCETTPMIGKERSST